MVDINRRTYLRGVITSGILGIGSTAGAASASSDTEEETTKKDLLKGRALIWEVDMDGHYQTEMHFDGDPSPDTSKKDDDSPDRTDVVHVTSNGTETSDYAHGMINLRDRLPEPLTVEEAIDHTISFDYYEGSESTNTTPDEVFVLVRSSSDGKSKQQHFLAYRHVNQDSEFSSDEGFRTLDVSAEMGDKDTEWKDTKITADDFVNRTALRNTLLQLSDEGSFSSFTDKYDKNAELIGVGFGQGFLTQKRILDAYYDDLTVEYPVEDDETETKQFNFPAALSTELKAPDRLNVRRDGSFTVTAKLKQKEEGISLENVIKKSVRLTPFTRVAPPASKGVLPRRVKVDGQELTAQFPASKVSDLLEEGESKFVVAGELDTKNGSSFFGVDTVDVFSPGKPKKGKSNK